MEISACVGVQKWYAYNLVSSEEGCRQHAPPMGTLHRLLGEVQDRQARRKAQGAAGKHYWSRTKGEVFGSSGGLVRPLGLANCE